MNFKKLFCMAVAASMCMSVPCMVYADTLSEAVAAKGDAEESLSVAEEKLKKNREKQKRISNKIGKKNELLLSILANIEILHDEISEKQKAVEKTKGELDAAQEEKRTQEARMRLRIQYLYENGDTDMVALLVSGKDIGEAINHGTFAKDIYSYDRQLLVQYSNAVEKADRLLAKLKEEEADLAEREDGLKEMEQEAEEELQKLGRKSKKAKEEEETVKKAVEEYKEAIREQSRIIEEELEKENQRQLAAAKAVAMTSPVKPYDKTYKVSGEDLGTEIANYALQFVGNPYVFGGNSLTNGIDCSGFVQQVYAYFGYSLPRTSGEQAKCGIPVSAAKLRPGDIVCYSGHVAIYIGGGKIVHASSPSSGIKISNNIFYRTVVGFRRIVV